MFNFPLLFSTLFSCFVMLNVCHSQLVDNLNKYICFKHTISPSQVNKIRQRFIMWFICLSSGQ